MSVTRWDGDESRNDSARRVLVLPGARYGIRRAGLAWPARALTLQGWQVWVATWEMPMDQPREQRQDVVDTCVDELEETLGEPPHLVLAKSVGTLAAGWVADRAIPAIWTTPLLDDDLCVADIARASSDALLVAGSRDHTWDDDAAARTGKFIRRIIGPDHGWQTGDWRTELDAVGALTDAIVDFASALEELN